MRKIIVFLLLLLLLFSAAGMEEVYVPTQRDTKPAPALAKMEKPSLDAYTLLYETNSAVYYWREDRDILAVLDKANGYVWKTGADIGFSKQIKDAVKQAKTDEEKLIAAEPIEKSMNATYIGVANSLITIEYRDGKIFYLGSAAEKNVDSTLQAVPGTDNQFVLAVDFKEIDLQLKVYVTLLEKGLQYEVPIADITGSGKSVFTALWITPFLGASGGEAEFYDPATGDYGDTRAKYAVPGYALVPDGSGTLIRFQDNTVPFMEYIGDVFGPDLSTETYFSTRETDALATKNPTMPVFGIAHGNQQAAFVAYAEQGAEYLDIIMRPEENLRLKYNFCYPRFEYNVEFYKVYNRKGSGYFTKAEDLFQYDVKMTYLFLHGDGSDGSPSADYSGMAQAYRNHLIEKGVLTKLPNQEGDLPLRLDFILSDMKKSLIGHEQVITTTVGDVREILDEVINLGITNINAGLIGWQAGAETLARPDSWRFHSKIGREQDFKELFEHFAAQGVDISLAREYATINPRMTAYLGTAAKHINTWYNSNNREELFPAAPVTDFAFALPTVAADWLREIARRAAPFSQSLTISGISNLLLSSYDRQGVTLTLGQSMAAYREAMQTLSEQLRLNLEAPNVYMWQATTRFLQAPVGSSQYVFETDEVPFLQMVLRGTMEVYGPYSNFSFYTQEDILRMIDYNVSPAFILSKQPAHLLSETLSSGLYSTEFEQYRDLITRIYKQVNGALSQVQGFEWLARKVPANGIVVNEYKNDTDTARIVINYTMQTQQVEGQTIPPQSAVVIREVSE